MSLKLFDLGFKTAPRAGTNRLTSGSGGTGISFRRSGDPVPETAQEGHRPLGWASAAIGLGFALAVAVVVFLWYPSSFTLSPPALPDSTKTLPVSGPPPALLALAALAGLAILLGILAFLLYLLRRMANPLYWQLGCWFLVAVGILLRPIVASGADPLQTTIKGALVAGIISLGIFPALMRLLNKLKPEPGLIHVALPFALGFFMDVAQVMAKTYVPGFAWLQ